MQTLTQGRLLPLAAALALVAAPASALTISYSDGVDSYSITDNGAGDSDPASASLDYDSGSTNPLAGWDRLSTQATSCATAIDCPNLTLSFEANSLGDPADLSIMITETDLTLGGAPFAFDTALSGFTGGEVSIASYYDPSNAAFGMAEEIGDTFDYASPAGFSSFSQDDIDGSAGASPFSLTTVINISHDLGNTQTYGDSKVAVSAVPVPGALPLLAGALGFGGLVLRRRRDRA